MVTESRAPNPAAAKRRLFVGIALDDATRTAIVRAAAPLARPALGARLEQPEKLHVTLAFLGSVPEERVAPLIERLRGAAAALAPLALRFDTAGAFPKPRNAKLVWIGARTPDPAFVRLAEAVREAVRDIAQPDEKPPVLHVTVARLRERRRVRELPFAARTMPVGEIALFQSLPGAGTTRYEIVERFPLGVTDRPAEP